MKKNITEQDESSFKIFNLDISQISLILANIIPIIGILFWKWDLFTILILYWLESAVVGFYTILKMIFSTKEIQNPKQRNFKMSLIISKIILIPFFIFHYSGFMYGHIIFIFVMSSISQTNINLLATISNILISLIILIITHGISFKQNFLGKKEYEKFSPYEFMSMPYKRIIVMHLTILFGSFILMATQIPQTMAILLIILKIYLDVKYHNKEHQILNNTESKIFLS